jgi:peroxiredoxin
MGLVATLLTVEVHRRINLNLVVNPWTAAGSQVPSFRLPTPGGKSVQLSDYRGKAVLLNFFGDTCEPCLLESPWHVDIQTRDEGKGLQIIGIEMYGASNEAIAKYAKQFGTNYVLIHGNEDVGAEYGIGNFPTSYFLNSKGKIVSTAIGLHSKNEIEANVEAALRSD